MLKINMGNGTILEGEAAERYIREVATVSVAKALGKPVELRENGGGVLPDANVSHQQLVESFMSAFGMSREAAEIAAGGREEGLTLQVAKLRIAEARKPEPSPDASLEEVFRGFGLSETGAKAAARGRV